jgi:hypothetical protein
VLRGRDHLLAFHEEGCSNRLKLLQRQSFAPVLDSGLWVKSRLANLTFFFSDGKLLRFLIMEWWIDNITCPSSSSTEDNLLIRLVLISFLTLKGVLCAKLSIVVKSPPHSNEPGLFLCTWLNKTLRFWLLHVVSCWERWIHSGLRVAKDKTIYSTLLWERLLKQSDRISFIGLDNFRPISHSWVDYFFERGGGPLFSLWIHISRLQVEIFNHAGYL